MLTISSIQQQSVGDAIQANLDNIAAIKTQRAEAIAALEEELAHKPFFLSLLFGQELSENTDELVNKVRDLEIQHGHETALLIALLDKIWLVPVENTEETCRVLVRTSIQVYNAILQPVVRFVYGQLVLLEGSTVTFEACAEKIKAWAIETDPEHPDWEGDLSVIPTLDITTPETEWPLLKKILPEDEGVPCPRCGRIHRLGDPEVIVLDLITVER